MAQARRFPTRPIEMVQNQGQDHPDHKQLSRLDPKANMVCPAPWGRALYTIMLA